MKDDEKVGRNSSGNRSRESQPKTSTPSTAIAMVTRRSTANRMIGLTFIAVAAPPHDRVIES